MAKKVVLNLKREPELRDGFTVAAQTTHLQASQVVRDDIRQQQARPHDEFVQRKVAAASASVKAGRGRSDEAVEATFVARRTKALGHE